MKQVRYTIKQPYVNHSRYEPRSDGEFLFYGEVNDLGGVVEFKDDRHSYIVEKGGRERHPGDGEPVWDNFDWGNIFRIWAIANEKPFMEDIARSIENKKLYYIEDLKNNINNLLNFEGSMIYCGKGKNYVNICPVHCYTGVQYTSEGVYVFDQAPGVNCFFV